MSDPVNQPQHYTSHPSGVECIEIVDSLTFSLGNAIKYVFRAGLKASLAEDVRKALWYLQREQTRLRATGAFGSPRPRRARLAARRLLEHGDDGPLGVVLRELFTGDADVVTELEIRRAELALSRWMAAASAVVDEESGEPLFVGGAS